MPEKRSTIIWPEEARELLFVCRENIEDDVRLVKEKMLEATTVTRDEKGEEKLYKIVVAIQRAHAVIVSVVALLIQLLSILKRPQKEIDQHQHVHRMLTEAELWIGNFTASIGHGGQTQEMISDIEKMMKMLDLDVPRPTPMPEDKRYALIAQFLREGFRVILQTRSRGPALTNGYV